MRLVPIGGRANPNLYRHPETGMIYFCLFKNKQRVRKSTKTDVLTDARLIADKFRLELLGETKIKRGRKTAFEYYQEWMDRKKIKSAATVLSIQNTGKHLEPYLSHMLPDEIDAKWWESVYLPEKLAQAPGRKFFNDRKWLTMFLISLQRDGVVKSVPRFVDPDGPRVPGRVYTELEIKSLLGHAPRPLELQILMGVTMGMRLGEIMNLTWDRIDMQKRVIHLRAEDTKIRKARSFAISAVVTEILLSLKASGGPLFESPTKAGRAQGRLGNKRSWAMCKRLAGIDGRARFHDLRHTFLTWAFKAHHANPALICEYAGLSLEEAQKTYLHFTVEDTRDVANLIRI